MSRETIVPRKECPGGHFPGGQPCLRHWYVDVRENKDLFQLLWFYFLFCTDLVVIRNASYVTECCETNQIAAICDIHVYIPT